MRTNSLITDENQAEIEENADDSENDLEMMRLRRMNLSIEESPIEEEMNRNLRHLLNETKRKRGLMRL